MVADNREGISKPTFYTVRQIAERWDCSEKHVRRMIKKGDLVVHNFGNLQRISDDDLRRYERMNRMV